MKYLCTDVHIEKGKNSTVTATASIPADALASFRAKALEKLSASVKIDGFRTGHIPEDVLVARLGEGAIMQEAAELAIHDQYPQLVIAEKLPLIGRPNVSVSKLALGTPMIFTLTGTLLPEVTLPDYTGIAKKHNAKLEEQGVTDEEVNDTLTHLRRERAKIERIEAGTEPAKAAEEAAALAPDALPPLDDAFVKTLGYDTVAIFTEKLRENIKNEKNNREREKNRIAIIEAIIKATPVEIPELLVDAELSNMESQFSHDLAHNGTALEAYLADTKKTREQLLGEWREGAKKRAAMQLISREIALKEEITPDPNQIAGEVEHILSHTKGADMDSVQSYVTNALRTEMVFRFLEEQK